MISILAVITPPIAMLILIVAFLLGGYLYIKLKGSKGVDKLTESLFETPKNDTVDNIVDGIKEGKDKLVQKGKENAQKVKEFAKEQAKIEDGLKK